MIQSNNLRSNLELILNCKTSINIDGALLEGKCFIIDFIIISYMIMGWDLWKP